MPNEPRSNRLADLETLAHDHFHDHVGSLFQVQANPETIWAMTLIKVIPGKVRPTVSYTLADGTRKSTRPQSFTLLFKGPEGGALPQNTYHFSHEVLGAGHFCITPHTRHQEPGQECIDHHDHDLPVIYQATFN